MKDDTKHLGEGGGFTAPRPTCLSCGRREDEHNVRHPFVHADGSTGNIATAIDAVRLGNGGCICQNGARITCPVHGADVEQALIEAEERHRKAGYAVPAAAPIPMRLTCPDCGELHVDEGGFATKPHHTHACQHCGAVWRPALVATVGVRFLPGFKNGAS